MRRSAALLLGVLASVAGMTGACRKEGGADGAPPKRPESVSEKLAQRAVEAPTPERELTLVGSAPVSIGTVEVSVRKLSVQGALQTEKVTLTTQDQFVMADVALVNVGDAAKQVSLHDAQLATVKGERLEIARDAQVLAGRRDLVFTLAPGERQRAVLVFEAPDSAIAPGLGLLIPGEGGAKDGVLPLQ